MNLPAWLGRILFRLKGLGIFKVERFYTCSLCEREIEHDEEQVERHFRYFHPEETLEWDDNEPVVIVKGGKNVKI